MTTTNTGRIDLDTANVRELSTWNPIAGTAILADGRKVREMHDTTTGETWYVLVAKSAKRDAARASLNNAIADILVTPEETFGRKE